MRCLSHVLPLFVWTRDGAYDGRNLMEMRNFGTVPQVWGDAVDGLGVGAECGGVCANFHGACIALG